MLKDERDEVGMGITSLSKEFSPILRHQGENVSAPRGKFSRLTPGITRPPARLKEVESRRAGGRVRAVVRPRRDGHALRAIYQEA